MPYCPKCKVELGPQTKNCPLCGAAPVKSLEDNGDGYPSGPGLHADVSFAPDVRNADERERLSPSEFRMMVVELLSVSIGIVLIVTSFIDIIFFHGLTWSRFSSLSLVMLWLCIAMPLILWGHPWLAFSVLGPAALLTVFLWFACIDQFVIFLHIGMPITILLEGAVISSGVLISLQNKKGLNAVGVVLAAVGIVCAGIESILSLFLQNKVSLYWSVVVVLSAIPVAGLFFYLHYRVTNRASLKKLLRL